MAAWSSRIGVWMYRRLNGRAMGGAKAAPVLLLTVAGRSPASRARPRSATSSTRAATWSWARPAAPRRPPVVPEPAQGRQASIEVGACPRRSVGVRILRGAERDRVWQDVVLGSVPAFAKYATKSGRTMPLALLTPVG